MQTISTVGIISKPKIARAPEIVSGLLAWLDKRQVRYRCDQLTAEYGGISQFFNREQLYEEIDLLIVLGGDAAVEPGQHRETIRALWRCGEREPTPQRRRTRRRRDRPG